LSNPKIHINADESFLLIKNKNTKYSSDDKAFEKEVKEIFQKNSSPDEIFLEK